MNMMSGVPVQSAVASERLSAYVRPATHAGRSVSLVQNLAEKWDLPTEIQTLIEFHCHRAIFPLTRPLVPLCRQTLLPLARRHRQRQYRCRSLRLEFDKRHVCWTGWTGCTCPREFCLCRPIPVVLSTPSGIKVSPDSFSTKSSTVIAQRRQLKQHYANWKD